MRVSKNEGKWGDIEHEHVTLQWFACVRSAIGQVAGVFDPALPIERMWPVWLMRPIRQCPWAQHEVDAQQSGFTWLGTSSRSGDRPAKEKESSRIQAWTVLAITDYSTTRCGEFTSPR